jgi:hypothetical protein
MADKTSGTPANKAPGSRSKKEAVRRALQDLGREAKPMPIRDHVKQHYHIDMGLDHLSTVKGETLRETGQANPTAEKPATTKPVAPQAAAARPALHKAESAKAARPQAAAAWGIALTDIDTVKELLQRLGATNLKKLIDVMAR